MACWTILKKKTCLGRWSTCGGDPAVTLHLRTTAKYRLPTFSPHGTKLGHSWFHWKTKNDVVGWFDNFEKGDVSGNFERLRRWSRCYTPPQEHCRLRPTYFKATRHQTRAFLISVKNKKWFSGWFDNSEKGDVSGNFERLRGWSRGCTPPHESCRLPTTYFWVTLHQTRAFLISMKNEKWYFGWYDNSEKGDVSGNFERLQGWSCGFTPPQEDCRQC